MAQAAPHVNGSPRRSGRFTSQLADLEELVSEIQSQLHFQLNDHAELSRIIVEDRGREAVEDRNFARARDNVRFAIDHGSRRDQLDALDRLVTVHQRDEDAEDAVIRALLALLGVHNADLHDITRLVRDNARAITHGEPVVLPDSEPAIPAALLRRQKAARA